MRDYNEIIEELVKCLRENVGSNVVSFELYVNGTEHSYGFVERSASCLRASGVSMRNLAGDFIK